MGRALRKHGSTVCGAGCSVCRAASFMHSRRMSEAQLGQANGSSSSAPGSPQAQASQAGQASPAASAAASASAAAAASGLAGLHAAPSSASLSSSAVRSEPPSPTAHTLTTAGSLGPASPHFVLPAADAAERQGGEEWRELEGEYCSIMCIVMVSEGGRGSSSWRACMHSWCRLPVLGSRRPAACRWHCWSALRCVSYQNPLSVRLLLLAAVPQRQDQERHGALRPPVRRPPQAGARLKVLAAAGKGGWAIGWGHFHGCFARVSVYASERRSGLSLRMLNACAVPPAQLAHPLPPDPLPTSPPPASPQYLRFLLHMSRHGCAPGALKYVTVLDAVAVQVEPLGAAGQPASGGSGQQQPSGKLSCWVRSSALLSVLLRPDFSHIFLPACHALLCHILPTDSTFCHQLISTAEPGWRAAARAGPGHCGRGAPRPAASVFPRGGAVNRRQTGRQAEVR